MVSWVPTRSLYSTCRKILQKPSNNVWIHWFVGSCWCPPPLLYFPFKLMSELGNSQKLFDKFIRIPLASFWKGPTVQDSVVMLAANSALQISKLDKGINIQKVRFHFQQVCDKSVCALMDGFYFFVKLCNTWYSWLYLVYSISLQ